MAAAAELRARNAGDPEDKAREEAFAKGIMDNIYMFCTPEELRAQREELRKAADDETIQARRMEEAPETMGDRTRIDALRDDAEAKEREIDKLNNALASQEAMQTIQATAGTETGALIQEALNYVYKGETGEQYQAKKYQWTPTMKLQTKGNAVQERYLSDIRAALKADGFDEKAADNAVETLRREFNAEQQRQQNENLDKLMSRSGFGGWLTRWGMTLASVPMNLLSPIGMLAPVVTALDGSDYTTVDPNSALFAPANTVNTIRETHQKYNAGGKLNDMLYGIITSSMDSLLGGLVGGGITSGLGLAGNAAAWVGGSVIGAEAAAQSMQDIAARGGNVTQVLSGGLMAGAFETIFEQFSLSQLQGLAQMDVGQAVLEAIGNGSGSLKTALREVIAKNVVKGMITNGSEELFTELANVLFDTLVMGDISNYGQMVKEYMAMGMTEDEARKKATQQLANQVLEAGFTGALQGLLMDIAALAGNDTRNLSRFAGEYDSAQAQSNGQNQMQRGLSLPAVELAEWRGETKTAPETGAENNYANYNIVDGADTIGKDAALSDAYDKVVDAQKSIEIPEEAIVKYEAINNDPAQKLVNAVKDFYDHYIKGSKVQVRMNNGTLEIMFENDGKKKSVGWRMKPEKAASFERLIELTENAEYAYSETNRDANEATSIPMFHYYVADAVVGGKHIPVKIQVRDVITSKNTTETHYYTHNYDKRGSNSPVAGAKSTNIDSNAYTSSESSIRDADEKSNTKNSLKGSNTLAEYIRRQQAGALEEYIRQLNVAAAAQKPGLTVDSYTESALDSETAERLDQVAKALGVIVRFVDSVAGGIANSSIQGNLVLIEKGNPNPVNFLLGHEITHRMQELAPKQYEAFKKLVIQDAETRQDVRDILDNYSRKGLALTEAGAIDEAVADYAGRMMEDGQLLDSFIRRHSGERTLLEKIRDAFQALIEKLHGGERRQAQQAVDRLNRALNAAAAQAETWTQTENGVERYSISKELRGDLKRVLNNTFRAQNNEVYIGESSNFLTDTIGAKKLTVTMPASKAYSAMVTEVEARQDGRYQENTNYHGLGLNGLMQALEASEHPVAAFAAVPEKGEKRTNSIVLVTDQIDTKGDYIAVVQMVDAKGHLKGKRIDTNKVITTYGRGTIAADIQKAAADGRLLSFDKKRSQNILAGAPGSNSLRAIQEADFKANIQRFWENVKWEKSGRQIYTAEGQAETETELGRKLRAALGEQDGGRDTRNSLKGTDHTKAGIERRRNDTEAAKLSGLESVYRQNLADYDAARSAAAPTPSMPGSYALAEYIQRQQAGALEEAYRRSLANYDAAAGRLTKADLQSLYEAAIAQAKADGDSNLASALHQELLMTAANVETAEIVDTTRVPGYNGTIKSVMPKTERALRGLKRPKLSKQEWRQIQGVQMQKYARMAESDIPDTGYVFAHDKFYLIHNYGLGTFEVTARLNPATQQGIINDILEGTRHGNDEQFGQISGETDEKHPSDEGGHGGRGPDAGDGGERSGVFRVVQGAETGSDTAAVFREGSRNPDGEWTGPGGRDPGGVTPGTLPTDQRGWIKFSVSDEDDLQSLYEAAIAQAKADGDSNLASALYQELLRVLGLRRGDE